VAPFFGGGGAENTAGEKAAAIPQKAVKTENFKILGVSAGTKWSQIVSERGS